MSGTTEIPRGNAQGFRQHLKHDIVSGLLVFLIALPLCLGIAIASGYPPLAGIFTAIIGSILTTFISNSELTIKGPAAGLIVIAIGCIEDFGGDGMTGGFTPADLDAYKAALAVGVVAAFLQILFGLFRAGILGEFFPTSAVHGMLAAIGVIIIAKQIPVALGVTARGEPLELLRDVPRFIAEANPAIATIGVASLLIMFVWPILKKRAPLLKPVPAQLAVIVAAVPLGIAFDLLHDHSYVLQGHKYQLGEQYLVSMPDRVFGMFDEITFPNFSALTQPKTWKWIGMFFIIGSLESLLSAKAVDLIDPWKRKTNLNRDVLAVGIANMACAFVGGLPMISEIVRSRANIDNGARTRFADMWHGLFLLLCVALIPMWLHRIPLSALAAMLVYTGYRLAHPSEFVHVYQIGREQLVIFVSTIIGVLATDLLIGICIGIAVKMCIHALSGVPFRSMFKPYLDITEVDATSVRISARHSAVFSNWIPFRRAIENVGLVDGRNVVVDLSGTRVVDHSVMDRLHEMQRDFEEQGLSLTIAGLEEHQPVGSHQLAARKRRLAEMQRLTLIADESIEEHLVRELLMHGAVGFTAVRCYGASRRFNGDDAPAGSAQVRIEVIAPHDVCELIMSWLRQEVLPLHPVSVVVETVNVLRRDPFVSDSQARQLVQH